MTRPVALILVLAALVSNISTFQGSRFSALGESSAATTIAGEFNMTGTAIWIVDGDTFDVNSTWVSDAQPFHVNQVYRIRFADIDTPESDEPGYSEAKDYLSSLIKSKTVYLNIDDIFIYDYSGTGNRLVCVAYIIHNTTHYENVNKNLLLSGHAKEYLFHNEFDPTTWTLYVSKETIPEYLPFAAPLVLVLTTLAATLLGMKRKRWRAIDRSWRVFSIEEAEEEWGTRQKS